MWLARYLNMEGVSVQVGGGGSGCDVDCGRHSFHVKSTLQCV